MIGRTVQKRSLFHFVLYYWISSESDIRTIPPVKLDSTKDWRRWKRGTNKRKGGPCMVRFYYNDWLPRIWSWFWVCAAESELKMIATRIIWRLGADARIQKVLQTFLTQATTLTVAHRLNTIMDSSHVFDHVRWQGCWVWHARKPSCSGWIVDRWDEERKD